MPNGSTIMNDFLEIPVFSQSNLKISRFEDNPEFCNARLWRVAGSRYKTVG